MLSSVRRVALFSSSSQKFFHQQSAIRAASFSHFHLMMGTTASSSSAAAGDVASFINKEIANNQVVIWSKSYCPYCTSTKQLFHNLGNNVQVSIHELDRMGDGSAIQNQLATMTGQRSVPNVFVNGQHVGGNDDTQAAHRNGRLSQLLAAKN